MTKLRMLAETALQVHKSVYDEYNFTPCHCCCAGLAPLKLLVWMEIATPPDTVKVCCLFLKSTATVTVIQVFRGSALLSLKLDPAPAPAYTEESRMPP